MRCSTASGTWPRSSRTSPGVGARLLLQTALEAEIDEFLGRSRYQRAAGVQDARPGMRNGYHEITVKTTFLSYTV